MCEKGAEGQGIQGEGKEGLKVVGSGTLLERDYGNLIKFRLTLIRFKRFNSFTGLVP